MLALVGIGTRPVKVTALMSRGSSLPARAAIARDRTATAGQTSEPTGSTSRSSSLRHKAERPDLALPAAQGACPRSLHWTAPSAKACNGDLELALLSLLKMHADMRVREPVRGRDARRALVTVARRCQRRRRTALAARRPHRTLGAPLDRASGPVPRARPFWRWNRSASSWRDPMARSPSASRRVPVPACLKLACRAAASNAARYSICIPAGSPAA